MLQFVNIMTWKLKYWWWSNRSCSTQNYLMNCSTYIFILSMFKCVKVQANKFIFKNVLCRLLYTHLISNFISFILKTFGKLQLCYWYYMALLVCLRTLFCSINHIEFLFSELNKAQWKLYNLLEDIKQESSK